MEGESGGAISGGGSGGSDGGSGVGTSICNGNGVTVDRFITELTITGSETTFLSTVSNLSSDTASKTVEAQFTACSVLFRYLRSGGGGGMGTIFTFLWIILTFLVAPYSPKM